MISFGIGLELVFQDNFPHSNGKIQYRSWKLDHHQFSWSLTCNWTLHCIPGLAIGLSKQGHSANFPVPWKISYKKV